MLTMPLKNGCRVNCILRIPKDTQCPGYPGILKDTQRYSVIPKIHYLLDSLVLGLDK